jgi:asparaginyl-tRNA synthetase
MERPEDLNFINAEPARLSQIKKPFEKLKYDKAIEKLRSEEIKVQEGNDSRLIAWGDDLNIDSERSITRDRNNPVFIVGYPLKVKPFYVKEDPENEGIALSTDLLLPNGFGEVSSGGMREDNIDSIEERIRRAGFDPSTYSWYLDLRKYGSVPHGGFGIGIERLIRWLIYSNDIKDCVLFPRTITRVMP